MKYIALSLVAIMPLSLLGGCASIGTTKEQQMQYQGPPAGSIVGKIVHDFIQNPCALGGVDTEASNHCAQASWGKEGRLAILNREVADELSENDDCKVHAARVMARLSGSGNYHAEPIYSCPQTAPQGVCHVSVLVTHVPSNSQYVLDNGSVLSMAATGGFGSYDQFVSSLNGADHWTGTPDRHSLALSAR